MPTSPRVSPTSAPAPSLPAALRLGPVHITVSDLARSIVFYERSIGLQVHGRDGSIARLGAGEEDLLVLVEELAPRPAGRHAGLYHFALLHPSRVELARAALRLAATRTPISGASDHGISEAIYLPDPDGNGIELAADRPRSSWPDLSNPGWDGGPEPLDMESLLELVEGEEPRAHADPRLVVGHLHLHVGDIERGLAFYRDVLGFEALHDEEVAGFRYLHIGLPGQATTGIWLMPPSTDEERRLVGRQAGNQPLLVLYTDDLDDARRQLAAHDIGVWAEHADDGGRSLHFRDVAGNVVVAAELTR